MTSVSGTGTTRIRLLPVFDLIRDGERLCPPVRARRLIVLLAVHDGPVERTTVAERLWPDVVTSRACASLRATVWGLTRSAWSPVLVTADSLMLDPAVGCDLRDARAAATAIIDGCTGRADRDTVQLLSADLLPGSSDEWLDDERRRFRQLRLHALDALCRDQADAGRFAQAVLAGLAGVSSDPLRESAHRALMYAHLREGNPSEAIRQYHRYCRIAREELGIGASTRMQRMLLEALDDAAETLTPLSGAGVTRR